jgi:hypothetical protein
MTWVRLILNLTWNTCAFGNLESSAIATLICFGSEPRSQRCSSSSTCTIVHGQARRAHHGRDHGRRSPAREESPRKLTLIDLATTPPCVSSRPLASRQHVSTPWPVGWGDEPPQVLAHGSSRRWGWMRVWRSGGGRYGCITPCTGLLGSRIGRRYRDGRPSPTQPPALMKWVAGCPIKIRVVPRGRDTVADGWSRCWYGWVGKSTLGNKNINILTALSKLRFYGSSILSTSSGVSGTVDPNWMRIFFSNYLIFISWWL